MIGYLDCSSGVSGDKYLGALVDAGFGEAELQAGLDSLGLDIRVEASPANRGGVEGLTITIEAPDPQPSRTWAEIRSILTMSTLPERARQLSLEAFGLLAEAEAEIHGTNVDDVHFHEVGAADSIGDIVGVCLGLVSLGVDRLIASPIATGSGVVETSHGTLPVPAPATAKLLVGMPLDGAAGSGELTTPTGAALLAATVDAFGPPPDMTLRAIGRGAGSRETQRPNITTFLLGDAPEQREEPADAVIEMATNLDHITPEHLATASERLLAAGALDVWNEPVVMKKGRPGWVLRVLSAPGEAPRLAEEMLRQTGTLGIRMRACERITLPRETVTLETTFGPVRFKVAHAPDGQTARPEADDVGRIAVARNLPFDEVASALSREAEELLEP